MWHTLCILYLISLSITILSFDWLILFFFKFEFFEISVPYTLSITASEGRNVSVSLPPAQTWQRPWRAPFWLRWKVNNMLSQPDKEDINFDKYCWPYPEDQMAWLAKCALQLAENSAWLDWLRQEVFPIKKYADHFCISFAWDEEECGNGRSKIQYSHGINCIIPLCWVTLAPPP